MRGTPTPRTATAAALLALVLGPIALARAEPKYYVEVRSVIENEGVQSGIATEALDHLRAELAKRPECTLDSPVDKGASPDALRSALKQKKLRGIELSLKILAVEDGLDPPPAGKQYKVLTRGIKVSLFGNTIPDQTLSLGGDGESTIKVELGKRSDVEQERRALLLEASKSAMIQAVDMTLRKLESGGEGDGRGKRPKRPKSPGK